MSTGRVLLSWETLFDSSKAWIVWMRSISPPRPRLAPPGVSTGWPGRPVPEPALEGDETGAVGPHPQSFRDGDESTTRTHQFC